MAVYLPGPGFTGSLWKDVLVGTSYMVLGPIGAGLWVRDVEVVATGIAVGTVGFGIGVGGVGEASAVCYGSSRPLVRVSTGRIDGHPSVMLNTRAEGTVVRVSLPVGMRAGTGAKYVIVAMTLSGIGNIGTLAVSVRTLQILREADLEG